MFLRSHDVQQGNGRTRGSHGSVPRCGGDYSPTHALKGHFSHDGARGLVDDEPVHLHLQSARTEAASDGEACAEPPIKITVMPFNTWQIVKLRIKELWPGLKHVPESHIRLLYRGVELRTASMVNDYFMEGGDAQYPIQLEYLIIDHNTSQGEVGLYASSQIPCCKELRETILHAKAAMLQGLAPRLTEDGTGATYLLRDAVRRATVAIFKPKDEEAFAPQNPRGYCGPENSTGLRAGVLSTQQAAREVAAHMLDYGKAARVPATTLAYGKHPRYVKVGGKIVWKVGAFQIFADNDGTCSDYANQNFSQADVHRIGILDIRIVNLDRNDGNVLVKSRGSSSNNRLELVPIDHGLSLPDRLEVYMDDIAWMSWPQAKAPFEAAEIDYIKNLNSIRDAKRLEIALGIRRECLRLLETTTTLLQLAVEHGLTLYDVGTIMYREDPHANDVQPSALEQIIEKSLDVAIVIAADSSAANAVSPALSSLDLQTCRSCGAGSNAASEPLRSPPSFSRQISPFTPMSNVSAPTTSPLVPPQLTLPAAEFSADVATGSTPFCALLAPFDLEEASMSSISTLGSSSQPLRTDRALSLDDIDDLESQSQQFSKQGGGCRKSNLKAYKNSAAPGVVAKRRIIHRERGSGHGIFTRHGLSGNDWTPAVERAYRTHVEAGIKAYLKKKFPRS